MEGDNRFPGSTPESQRTLKGPKGQSLEMPPGYKIPEDAQEELRSQRRQEAGSWYPSRAEGPDPRVVPERGRARGWGIKRPNDVFLKKLSNPSGKSSATSWHPQSHHQAQGPGGRQDLVTLRSEETQLHPFPTR